MYRVNYLARNTLITTDEVIFHAPTKHTLDPRIIETSIIIAEERFARQALGHDFYEALIAEKNLVITAGNQAAQQALLEASMGTQPEGVDYPQLAEGDIVNAMEYMSAENKALWKAMLWKYVAECVIVQAYPELYIHVGSEGLVHNAPAAGPMNTAGIVTPDLKSVKWAMDQKIMSRIHPLEVAMHLWLCKQKEDDEDVYELYEKTCECDEDGVAYKKKSDFILGIYDDEDTTSCCT